MLPPGLAELAPDLSLPPTTLLPEWPKPSPWLPGHLPCAGSNRNVHRAPGFWASASWLPTARSEQMARFPHCSPQGSVFGSAGAGWRDSIYSLSTYAAHRAILIERDVCNTFILIGPPLIINEGGFRKRHCVSIETISHSCGSQILV